MLGVLSRGTRSGLLALGLCWRGVRGEMPLSPTILGTCVLDSGAFSSIPSVLENWTRPLGRVAANKSDRLQLPSIVVICKMLRHLIWWFRRQSREEKASAASELPSAMISSGVSIEDSVCESRRKQGIPPPTPLGQPQRGKFGTEQTGKVFERRL